MISQFIKDRLNPYINVNKDNISIDKTTNSINIQILPSNKKLDCIINLERVNNIRWINKFHEDVNSKLEKDGIYLSCGETIKQRKKRVKERKTMPVGEHIFSYVVKSEIKVFGRYLYFT